jgi:hypothetical protein
MTLITEQHLFLLDVAKLIVEAQKQNFIVTGGELYRTAEQQAIHVKAGRSKTMNSKHLQRLAIDLNFFTKGVDGTVQLTYDIAVLKPLGDFWESLSPGKNSWGGNWNSFKDVPHFERS